MLAEQRGTTATHSTRNRCAEFGEHKFYVAATIGVEAEGKAVIIVCCTACGKSFKEEFLVSAPGRELLLEDKTNK